MYAFNIRWYKKWNAKSNRSKPDNLENYDICTIKVKGKHHVELYNQQITGQQSVIRIIKENWKNSALRCSRKAITLSFHSFHFLTKVMAGTKWKECPGGGRRRRRGGAQICKELVPIDRIGLYRSLEGKKVRWIAIKQTSVRRKCCHKSFPSIRMEEKKRRTPSCQVLSTCTCTYSMRRATDSSLNMRLPNHAFFALMR